MNMNLKEAFHYKNYLDRLSVYVRDKLQNRNNILEVTQTHLRSKANATMQDEVVSGEELNGKRDFDPNDLIDAAVFIFCERELLMNAIAAAKRLYCPQIDTMLSLNNNRRELAALMSTLVALKPVTRIAKGTGMGYCMNAEGNQTPVRYDIKEESTPIFDREKARSIMKQMADNANAVSTQVDESMLDTKVDFTPNFDVNDTMDDSISAFCARPKTAE